MNEAKVALVTGSSSGIGEATVKLFAKKGFKVVVCGSRKEKVDRVASECAQLSQHGPPLALVLDFRMPENGEVAVKKTIEHFGRLDVLVNNAGIFDRTAHDDDKVYEKYKEIVTVNMDATVRASLAAAEHLKATRGCMLFNSSIGAIKPHMDCFGYCMSKAAMTALARCLAMDLAPHVRVNVVSPGPIKTDIMQRAGITGQEMGSQVGSATLRGTIGESEEVAALFYYLASDEAANIQGQDIVTDGGYTLRSFQQISGFTAGHE